MVTGAFARYLAYVGAFSTFSVYNGSAGAYGKRMLVVYMLLHFVKEIAA